MTTSRSKRRARGPRRVAEWYDTEVLMNITAGTQASLNLTAGIVDDLKKGTTIVRMIFQIAVRALTVNTAARVAIGMAMVSTEAASASAFPEPGTANDQVAWLWRTQTEFRTSLVNDQTQVMKFQEDIRSARKFAGADFDLYMVVNEKIGASALDVDGWVRTLTLKH